ncbi:hypothetical protein BJ741DRAFT_624630 [Chytriomyces cf. hyalinus JEL632]|nr:hypothetical protein BJ741DRAFT_624630 [Chytriomyces cf. hyalinus JEL632]
MDATNGFLARRNLPLLPKHADQLGLSPYPAYALSAACFASSIAALRNTPGWAGTVPLVAFAGAFGMSGYATTIDKENGPSMATAWGSVYLFFFGREAIKAMRPGPLLLTAGVAGSTYVYGKEFIEMWT